VKFKEMSVINRSILILGGLLIVSALIYMGMLFFDKDVGGLLFNVATLLSALITVMTFILTILKIDNISKVTKYILIVLIPLTVIIIFSAIYGVATYFTVEDAQQLNNYLTLALLGLTFFTLSVEREINRRTSNKDKM